MKRPSEQRVIVDSRYDGYDVGDEIGGLFIVHYAPKFTYDFPIYDILGLSMRAQISVPTYSSSALRNFITIHQCYFNNRIN